jgi:hypothetical protein
VIIHKKNEPHLIKGHTWKYNFFLVLIFWATFRDVLSQYVDFNFFPSKYGKYGAFFQENILHELNIGIFLPWCKISLKGKTLNLILRK